jgi:FkbM family methyltransferase
MLIKLEDIIRKYCLKINGVIHIGAHYGQEYPIYKRNGIKNMLFFEPLQSNYDQLLKTLANDSTAVPFKLALGNQVGEVQMFVETVNNGMSSSVLEPGTHLKQYPQIVFDQRETVMMEKLDMIMFDHSKYNMINIDVQGYELEVFKGAVNTLKYIDIIYSEVNFEEVYKGCCLVRDLDRFLVEFGFHRLCTNDKPRSWGDALYFKI